MVVAKRWYVVGPRRVTNGNYAVVVNTAVEERPRYRHCVGTQRSNEISTGRKILCPAGMYEDPGKDGHTQQAMMKWQHSYALTFR